MLCSNEGDAAELWVQGPFPDTPAQNTRQSFPLTQQLFPLLLVETILGT